MTRVYVAAGSNVEPETNLARAGSELRRLFGAVDFSPAYRNRAVSFEGPDFINLVAGFDTDLPLPAVIGQLQRIESLCGRARNAPKWEPRSMDLDILLFGDMVQDTPLAKLPRPDLLKRPYMLGPLADIAPELRHPTSGSTIGDLWQYFERDHAMQRVELTLG